jgi:hypothetical protein
MAQPLTPSDADLALIIEYLDGNLDEKAMLAFEGRLEREPVLARALEEFEGIDLLQRAHVVHRPVGTLFGQPLEENRALARMRRKPVLLRLSFAAAVLALVGTAAWLLARGARPSVVLQVAALGIEEASPENVNRLLGLDERWLPSRMRARRGPDEPVPPSEKEYLSAVQKAQGTRARDALAAGQPSVSAGRFALVVRPERESWALVLSVDRGGGAERLFPEEGDPDPAGALAPGELAFLPRPFVAEERTASGESRAGFDYGFLVPLGSGELRILTAIAEEPISRELLVEIDRLLSVSSGSPAEVAVSLREWLGERGFSVGQTTVVEAGD